MSMLGNATFTSVQNQLGQLSYLDVSELRVVNATIGSLTITGDLIISGSITLTGDLTVGGTIFASDGSVGNPSYNFTNDTGNNTGMYHVAENQIGFSVGGTLSMGVSPLGGGSISVLGGTVGVPGYNFGIASGDTNTGMYRIQADTIGFSAGGALEAKISTADHLSVHIGDAGTPSFNFISDENTGMFNHGADIIGFTAGGAIEATISTANHLSVHNGLVGAPSFNFIDNENTGMYRIQADTIGFSTGGVQKVGIYNADSLPEFINGLNIGTSGSVAGIRRLSTTNTNSWEDGHMGNSTELVFTPSDFLGNVGNRIVSLESAAPNPRTGLGRWYGSVTGDATGKIVAQKIVPKGFIIDADSQLTIHTPAGNVSGTTCYVSGQAIDIGSGDSIISLLTTSAFETNVLTPLLGGGELIGDGHNIVTIYWESGGTLTTANSPSGAIITMHRI